MSAISKISPDGGTTLYDIKDAKAQTKVLSNPITIEGQTVNQVEDALTALNNKSGGGSADLRGTDTYNVLLVTTSEL